MTNIISEREELREKLKLLEASVGDHFSTEQSLNTLKESVMAEKKKYRDVLNGLQRVCYFYLLVAPSLIGHCRLTFFKLEYYSV